MPTFQTVVHVEADTIEQAQTVIRERLYYDDDLGFEYRIEDATPLTAVRDAEPVMVDVAYTRHYDARVHQYWRGTIVPAQYDAVRRMSSSDLDQWVCDNLTLANEEVEPVDDWHLDGELVIDQ